MVPIISGSATTNLGTIITIPAHTSWIGSLHLAARIIPSSAMPFIEVFDAGGNVQPPSGTKLIAVALSAQVSADSGGVDPVYVETGATSAVLRVNFDTAAAATASANGFGAG
jgi:hypothetical protein